MDDDDLGDKLMTAARAGQNEGQTREQFLNYAGAMWDAWEMAQKFRDKRGTPQKEQP